MASMEEWMRLGLDPRQWAYGAWWSRPRPGVDPELLDPQPAPPVVAAGSPWWLSMVALGSN